MKTDLAMGAGDILGELSKLSDYHAAQVKFWKQMLEQSPDNPYAKRMLATHLDFGGVLLLAMQHFSTSEKLEGTAT